MQEDHPDLEHTTALKLLTLKQKDEFFKELGFLYYKNLYGDKYYHDLLNYNLRIPMEIVKKLKTRKDIFEHILSIMFSKGKDAGKEYGKRIAREEIKQALGIFDENIYAHNNELFSGCEE